LEDEGRKVELRLQGEMQGREGKEEEGALGLLSVWIYLILI